MSFVRLVSPAGIGPENPLEERSTRESPARERTESGNPPEKLLSWR